LYLFFSLFFFLIFFFLNNLWLYINEELLIGVSLLIFYLILSKNILNLVNLVFFLKQFFILSLFLFCYGLTICNSAFFDKFVLKLFSLLNFIFCLNYYFFLFKFFFSKKKSFLKVFFNDKFMAKLFDFFFSLFQNRYLKFFFFKNVWFI
jgi:hypothetical protein